MARFAAVTAATGALGPVLVKLTALLGDEYKLQEGTRQDIMSIKSELEPVHDLLWKLWGREDLDVACKDWMMEARELSYDMEDDINAFDLSLDRGDGGLIIQRETTEGPFKEFMERVKGVSKRCREMHKIGDGDTICNLSKLTTDPRALFLHKDESELQEIEGKKKKLIELLQKHEMVCIVGYAGMGKTTLADVVYHAIGDEFQCRAFVSVHQRPNMMEILGTILSQVTNACWSKEAAAEQNTIHDISIFLSDKRYLVIIDDIWHWEEWEVIRKALPKNNLGCKIIMTSRINSIAGKCQTEQGAHVYTQKFLQFQVQRLLLKRLTKSIERYRRHGSAAERLSEKIVVVCGAIPLAVVCLSSAWAESHVDGDYEGWDAWESHMLDGFLSIPSLKPLVQSLCLGFDDLPVQLRTCLLYCSIYPRNHEIERDCLIRKWIVEGLVPQQEVAEAYFDELLSRNLLQPAVRRQNACIVQPIMQAFLVCKAREEKFVAACRQYNGPAGSSSSHGKQQIRRLSLYTDHYPDMEDVSHTRTLAVFGPQPQVHGIPFKKFENLRVLEIDSAAGLEDGHLVDICGLICLRYLGLNGCPQITELPPDIGRLLNLELLDVRRTGLTKLPKEIENLQHLETLHASNTEVTELPREIGKLQRLRTLDISCTGVRELPKEIIKLQHLRTLNIGWTKVRELPWEVTNSVIVTVGDMYPNQVPKLPLGDSSSGEVNCREDLSILVLFNRCFGLRGEVLPFPMFRVAGRHLNLPQWVKHDLRTVSSLDIRLCKLGEGDLECLQQMPNLKALQLRLEVLPREPIAITCKGFSMLEAFYVDCRLPWVIFLSEAMPKLKYLEFKFYCGRVSHQDYSMGIEHLDSIETIVFRCSEYYTSDGPGIREAIDGVRREAANHPNKITIFVNDMHPEVFSSGDRWISHAKKDFILKRERLRLAAERRSKGDGDYWMEFPSLRSPREFTDAEFMRGKPGNYHVI